MSPPRSGTFNTRAKQTFRKKVRNSATSAEAILWRYLQRRQLLGKKFRRQASIGRYIVDFYCPECRVIVELDGAAHFSITLTEYEAERTRYLEGLGLKVIRFENKIVFENIEAVLETIKESLSEVYPKATTPSAPLRNGSFS
jgi:very-short-patch-repair endonuclease